MATGTTDERITAAARWLRAAHERSATIQNVLDQAAAMDSDAAERLQVREQNRHDEVRWALRLVLGTPPPDTVVDEAWLIASRRQWLTLVADRGWSPSAWVDWFCAHLRVTLQTHLSSSELSRRTVT